MKKLALGVVLWLAVGALYAQPPNMMPMHQPPEQLETLRIWKMTEFLDLSEEQAARFFPALQTHREKIRAIDSTEIALRQSIAEKLQNGPVDQEYVDAHIAKITDLQRQKMEAETTFLKATGKYLTPEQQMKYIIFDDRFRRVLRDAIRRRGMMHDNELPKQRKRQQ